MKPRRSLVVDVDTPLGERHVNMSNALTRAAHGLSLAEKRLIAACIAQCDSVPADEARRKGALTTRLHALDYARMFEVDPNTAYEQLQEAGDHLFNRYITTVEEGRRGPQHYKFRWVGSARYHKGEGWIELQWWHEVVPHLLGLRKQFTSYKLKQAAAFRSIYTWRLFECMQSWNDKGRWAPTIEEFHQAMDSPESFRKDFKGLRSRVIEPALRELTEKGEWVIDYTPRKAGRKVIGLEFVWRKNPQRALL